MTATAKQRGFIHALAGKAGMDEETRRDFLQAQAGVRSVTQLSIDQAARIIDELRRRAGVGGAVGGLDTPAARKLRALWIAAYDLGLVVDRSDRALLAFLERQTGLSHIRFLTAPGQATAAIEALKSWLTRDGGVEWPDAGGVEALKLAVIAAQWRRLIDLGLAAPGDCARQWVELTAVAARITGKLNWSTYSGDDYAAVQRAFGRRLRAALAR